MGEKKLKIAFVSIYSGAVNRGVETVVHELASRLSHTHIVDVYQQGDIKEGLPYTTIRIPLSLKSNTPKLPVKDWRRRLFMDYWGRRVGLFSIQAALQVYGKNYDIVVTTNGGWQAFVFRLLTLFTKPKHVVLGGSGIGWDDRINLMCLPDSFVAPTTLAATWAKSLIPFAKVSYIPNGVNTSRFTPKGKKYATKLPHPIILSVGAFTEEKNLSVVIDAVAKTKASLLLVGDGPQKESLHALGKKLMKNRFELMESSYEKMPEIYRAADLFTLVPSTREAFGLVYLEAMASGIPVVAIDDPIRHEITGDAGLFVADPTDSEAYSKVLSTALSMKWGNRPRVQSLRFSWDTIAKEFEAHFFTLVK